MVLGERAGPSHGTPSTVFPSISTVSFMEPQNTLDKC